MNLVELDLALRKLRLSAMAQSWKRDCAKPNRRKWRRSMWSRPSSPMSSCGAKNASTRPSVARSRVKRIFGPLVTPSDLL
jgi:hypothetical protein